PENFRAGRRDRPKLNQLIEGQLVFLELANCERGAVDCKRRHDDVDARAIGKASVADWRGFVDAPADLTDDPLAYVKELRMVAKADVGLAHPALHFDEDISVAVDHNVRDVI